jgi:beta-glucosidase
MKNKSDDILLPEDFWLGTSLAAHQSEGGNHNSWTQWENLEGKIKNGDKSGLACDHWQRFEEDFENLSWLGVNTHRMSIEWSRLEPREGQWDRSAANQYRKMFQSLRRRDIRPVICLFHFTLPVWVSDLGGFENIKTIDYFSEFSKKAYDAFGDLVSDWLTLNEPVVYALGGYAAGLTPPGVKDLKRTMQVTINMLKAHGRAYHALKSKNSNLRVSFAQHMRTFKPKNIFSPLDYYGCSIANEILNWSWFKTILTGKIRVFIPTVFKAFEEAPECLGALDFIGLNYYSRDLISVNPFTEQKLFVTVPLTKTRKSDMGWDIHPLGLRQLLKGIKKKGLGGFPILITENGVADQKDELRSHFMFDHLKVFFEACSEFNLTPMGYLHWSLIDNFEWIDGFSPRFGLFAIDYNTLTRTARPSAHYFKALATTKILTEPLMPRL